MSSPLLHRLARFAGIGVINTLLDFALFALLVRPLGIVVAQIVASGISIAVSFVLNARFVFRAEELTWGAAARFFGTNLVNLWLLQPVVILGIAALIGHTVRSDYAVELLAKLGSVAVSMTINFLVYDRYIWPRTPNTEQSVEMTESRKH